MSTTPETARTAEQAYSIRQREEWRTIMSDILPSDEDGRILTMSPSRIADAIYNAIERLERRLPPPQASKGGEAHAAADQSKPFNTNPLGAVAWLHLPAILDRLESAEAREAEQRAEIERLREALTPSADTKAAYIGEFSWEESADDHRDKVTRTVPWTVVKEIMETIRNRAALAAKGGEK